MIFSPQCLPAACQVVDAGLAFGHEFVIGFTKKIDLKINPQSMKVSFLLLVMLLASGFVFGQSINLAPNPGFEQGTRSWVNRTATIDKSVRHSGNASLKYVNNDPKNYRVILTHINVKGGETLRFSTWVKGQDIKPAAFGKKGAGIYLHAYDENDKSLGGSNPPTPSGTFDWTQVEGLFELPADTRKIAISLYLVQGNTGTAWFDDIVVENVSLDQIVEVRSSLGTAADSTKPFTKDAPAKAMSSNGVFLDHEGFTVKNGERIFPFGIYIGKAERQGIWKQEDLHLNRIKDAGFNAVLSYIHGDNKDASLYLDKLDKLGLHSIFSLSYLYDGHQFYSPINGQRASKRVAEIVGNLKEKPALLSWYTGDEIELSHLIASRENYDVIKSIDNKHPIFQVTNRLDMVPKLMWAADIVGTDPYPIGKLLPPNLKQVREWTSATVKTTEQKKGVWQVVQIFNKVAFQKELSDDYLDPTAGQIQNMLFQSVIQGAKGILFYAYHPLWYGINSEGKADFSEEIYNRRWKEVAAVSRRFSDIIPVILANDVTTVSNIVADEGVIFKAWRYGAETYLMVANTLDSVASVVVPGHTIELEAQGSRWVKL